VYLVGVQSLLIYQIIRLFDGDIRQRANAERHSGLLEAWTLQLNSTNNICYNDCGTESLYQRWVFIESARRTVTMSIMVQAMYSLLKDGYCTRVLLLATLPVSVDGALWNASEETWWQTTLGSGGDLCTYLDFTNQWNEGQALYTDIYKTILSVACRHNLRRPPLMLVWYMIPIWLYYHLVTHPCQTFKYLHSLSPSLQPGTTTSASSTALLEWPSRWLDATAYSLIDYG